MSPTPRHAKIGKLIARLVETFTLELNIPLVGLSNTSWRNETIGRGLEADECYYIARAQWAAGREEFDLNVDPPPDLAIEVDVTTSSLDKQSIYAELGVPELWRHEDDKLSMLRLTPAKTYEPIAQSLNLPTLPPDVIEKFVRQRTSGVTDTEILAGFAQWVRENRKN
jgi:Uma2 family endonuclease